MIGLYTFFQSIYTPFKVYIARYAASTPSEGWGWVVVTAIDFPISAPLIALLHNLPPLVYFGIFGTLWWYLLGWLGAKLLIKILGNTSPVGTGSGREKHGTR